MQTNRELVDAWLTDLDLKRGRSKGTLGVYRQVTDYFLVHLGGIHVTEVELQDLEEFTARPPSPSSRAKGEVLAPATRRKEASVLRSFYRWMYEKHLTEVHLGLGLHTPVVHNVQPKSLSDDHWLSLWDSLAIQSNMTAVTCLGLGFFCGLRRDEMLQLRGSQVTDTQLVGFKRKGGGDDTIHWRSMHDVYATRLPHLVGSTPERFPTVLRWQAERAGDGPLLGWTAVGTMNKALHRWAGRTDTPLISPHQLRHSCATNLLRAGVPLHIVSSLLNHASIHTTMRYVRAGHDALAEWMEGVGGGGNPPPATQGLPIEGLERVTTTARGDQPTWGGIDIPSEGHRTPQWPSNPLGPDARPDQDSGDHGSLGRGTEGR